MSRESLLQHAIAGRGLWVGMFTDGPTPIAFGDLRCDDPHITLAHFGRRNEPTRFDRIDAAAQGCALRSQVVSSTIHGLARFIGGRDGDPIVALIQRRDFVGTFAQLMTECDTLNVTPDGAYDFEPHLTILRAPRGAAFTMPPLGAKAKLSFSTISVVCGGERATYNLQPPPF